MACRTAFEEGDHSSYELNEAEYAASDEEYLWVDRLLNALAIILQWFQPLLTMNNYDSLVSNLLSKVRQSRLLLKWTMARTLGVNSRPLTKFAPRPHITFTLHMNDC